MAKVKRSNRFCLHNLLINATIQLMCISFFTFCFCFSAPLRNEKRFVVRCTRVLHTQFAFHHTIYLAISVSLFAMRTDRTEKRARKGVSMITIVSLTLVIVFFFL